MNVSVWDVIIDQYSLIILYIFQVDPESYIIYAIVFLYYKLLKKGKYAKKFKSIA